MGEWKEYKLKDLLSEKGYIRGPFGSSLKRAEMKNKGIPVYEQQHAIYNTRDFRFFIDDSKFSEMKRFVVRANDLIISCSGTLGRVSIIRESDPRGIISQALLLLRPDTHKIFPEYLLYFFKTTNGFNQLVNASHGSVQQNIASRDVVEDILLSIPDKNSQQSILAVLSCLDDKIDLLNRQNKTLETLAETLFRQWFVEEAEGLETKTLEKLIYFDPREKVSNNTEYTFFDMKCLSNSSMAIADGIKRTVNSGSSFCNGDTLLAKITPCLENGKTGLVMNLEESELARGSTEFIVMRAKEGLSPYFVYCLARYSDFRNTAIQSMTGTSGRQRVQTSMLKNYEIKYSKDAMKTFHDTCHPNFLKIRQNQIQIHTLTHLRDTLLPKLMSGEVRVKQGVAIKEGLCHLS